MKVFFLIMYKYLFILFFLFVLNSCGLMSKKKITPDENAVLSGPPLAIPPDFDSNIDMSEQNENVPVANIPLENGSMEILNDEDALYPLSNLETNQIEDSTFQNNIQSFETFDVNNNNVLNTRQIQNNNFKSNRRNKKVKVPSDMYIPNSNRITSVNRSVESSKNYFSPSTNVFTNTSNMQEEGLTKAEKSLIEDLINNSNK